MREGLPVPINSLADTPDGKYAIVVAERKDRLDFVNPQTIKLEHALSVPCRGVDHMDFSADGRYLIASCEFSGTLVKVDVEKQSLMGELDLPFRGMPQDVKLSPDGTIFYVADMDANGVYEVVGDEFKLLGFIPTGKGAYGLYTSRDSRVLYVSHRAEFFPDRKWKVNSLINLGYGDHPKLHPRNPRLDFDEACRVL